METKALYIHIPFCDHICSYCDFAKVYYREEFVLQYLADGDSICPECHLFRINAGTNREDVPGFMGG